LNIRDYITKILYYPERLAIDFKMLNWTVELDKSGLSESIFNPFKWVYTEKT